MNSIKTLLLAIFSITLFTTGIAQTQSKTGTTESVAKSKVQVYYFHYTRRCATCNAVESVSKDAVKDLYGKKVSFSGYNLDEKEGEEKGKTLGISGQTLVIVSGDTKINITSEGFMNARSNPDKLKSIIKEKIDPLL